MWALSGPLFQFNDTWQLTVNTGTTVMTFLMVFLIQNTQARDSKAIQAKLDELIRATEGAHNAILDLEAVDEQDLEDALQKYHEIARTSRRQSQNGAPDTDAPELPPSKMQGQWTLASLRPSAAIGWAVPYKGPRLKSPRGECREAAASLQGALGVSPK